MANMGLDRLILVEPAAEIGRVATAFAVGAKHVLDACERKPSLAEALAPFQRVVGTTSARDRRWDVPLLHPRDLPARLAQDPPGTETALVFGPEVGGLTNDDLAFASLLVTIPCSPLQPTLNLAQAVLVLTYELYQARAAGGEILPPPATVGQPEPPATTAEVDGLFAKATAALRQVGFDRDSSFDGVMRDLRRLVSRAGLDRREVAILRAICHRTQRRLEALEKKIP
jgi:TrmH family RNA methyltransferase